MQTTIMQKIKLMKQSKKKRKHFIRLFKCLIDICKIMERKRLPMFT